MAFQCWYASQKESFAGLGSASATMKAAGAQWRGLTKEEKQQWKEKARLRVLDEWVPDTALGASEVAGC